MKGKTLTIVLLSVIVLTGCVYVDDTGDGGRDNRLRSQSQPTIGQELLDLDRARASGVISDTEFERAKEAILDDIN